MKELIFKIKNLNSEKLLPLAIVVTGLLLSASITFASFSFSIKREVIVEEPIETKSVLGVESIPSATPSPSPSIEPSPSISILVSSPRPSVKPTPTPSMTPSPAISQSTTQTPAPIIVQVVTTTPIPSQAPSPSPSLEPSPSPAVQMISVEIKQPGAKINFDLEITENINVCHAMQKSKDEGKINSLTISDKYLESFGTLLIEEINGFRDNWVFTVNGESPMGCSQSILKNNDKLAWEFLNL